jgi:hypothetical protein
LDAHYTPEAVAKALVASALDLRPILIADLAAGEGDLLFEAERVWPRAKFLATDIDRTAIRRLARLRPSWNVGRCDLRNPRSRACCPTLHRALGSASLLLLNPPFSCRGGTRFPVETPAGTLSASAAVSFVLIAASYLADNGEIVAILPSGCLHNVKDAQAWNYIRTKYRVRLLGDHRKGTFPGSTATTTLVRLSPALDGMGITTIVSATAQPQEPDLLVRVIRGCCPMHRARRERNRPILVHYTDLRQARVHLNGRRGFGVHRCVEGPAILIPRVGRITEDKIALLDAAIPVMISDCVIALKTTSLTRARAVQNRLVENFAKLRAHYVGTGAPFITLGRLRTALESVGINIDES